MSVCQGPKVLVGFTYVSYSLSFSRNGWLYPWLRGRETTKERDKVWLNVSNQKHGHKKSMKISVCLSSSISGDSQNLVLLQVSGCRKSLLCLPSSSSTIILWCVAGVILIPNVHVSVLWFVLCVNGKSVHYRVTFTLHKSLEVTRTLIP